MLRSSHHWALHDAFEEDEVQVIGSRWACAVAQCVQGLMHGYKHTHTEKEKGSLLYSTHGKQIKRERGGGTFTIAHTTWQNERRLEKKWAGEKSVTRAASHSCLSNFTSVSHLLFSLWEVSFYHIFLPLPPRHAHTHTHKTTHTQYQTSNCGTLLQRLIIIAKLY